MINIGKKLYTESNVQKALEKEIDSISTALKTQKNKNEKLISYIKAFSRKYLHQ